MDATTAHAILGVEDPADAGALRRAYRRALLQAHPDQGGSRAELDAVRRAFALLARSGGPTSAAERVAARYRAAPAPPAPLAPDAPIRPARHRSPAPPVRAHRAGSFAAVLADALRG